VLVEQNDLAGAEAHLARGIELGKWSGRLDAVKNAVEALSRLRQARGDDGGALAAVQEAESALGDSSSALGRSELLTLKARVLVRLDSGFVFPQLFDYLDSRPRLDYVVAYARNSVLERAAAHDMRLARRASRRSGQTERVYGQDFYQARTWPLRRRVIFKAERLLAPDKKPKDNLRFVVTNLSGSAQKIYERIYCPRGDAENRIKELLNDLALGRTSCSRFWANQFRVLLTAAAYVLFQEIRLHARRTRLGRAQVATLRDMLLKLGAEIERSTRRFVVHLPTTAPYRDVWQRVAVGLGARVG